MHCGDQAGQKSLGLNQLSDNWFKLFQGTIWRCVLSVQLSWLPLRVLWEILELKKYMQRTASRDDLDLNSCSHDI